jgi:hypothetical protein
MLNLIKLLLNNTIYLQYSKFIYNLIKNNKDLETLYKYIQLLQDKYSKDITIEELSLFVLSNCLDRDKEKFTLLLEELSSVENCSEILDDVLMDILRKHRAYEIALCAIDVSEGRKNYSDLLLCLDNLNVSEGLPDTLTEDPFISASLQEIYDGSITQHGLRWRLSALNRALGSLRKGDFGFIFARPETGKTTFLTSEITNFAQQTKDPILWFNNEEQGNKVQLRIYQAFFGYELVQLFSNISEHEQEYMKQGMDRIKIIDSASISKTQVEKLCKKYKPALVVVDQLDKIKGFDADRDDLRLGSIYIWAREIAKQYCPVIGICQSDASGEGKKWLNMDNVANAKTAKQAEADWIIGIGKTHSDSEQYQRFLSICKNKLIGDQDTDPLLRHGHLTVNILPEIGRYSD